MALNKIAIFLRKNWHINRFRNIIQTTFYSNNITEMILCSGFFQENIHFYSSDSFNSDICINKTLKLVGIYNYTWRAQFNDFKNNVIAKNCPTCLTVRQYRIPGMKWHAKIMIGKINDEPVVATIGSSNITGRAFGILPRNFNYECDVILWDESINDINNEINTSIEEFMNNADEVIISDYSENDWRNGNQSLNDKIKELEENIFNVAREE